MQAGCVCCVLPPWVGLRAVHRCIWPRHYKEYWCSYRRGGEAGEGKGGGGSWVLGSQVRRMRERLVGLIPGLIYGDPKRRMESMKDAFDVAVEGIIERVANRMGRRRRRRNT
ncbi:hypothetical protein HPP92_027967 [Vanilla planifolia]|uniref:Uncharacterized protein n=1 Tax=Vanilla planifolia TaxID=51239 RepID=A0A835U6S7_VANPL|nr:hypothetical protein HPP92_027967 [Vanilla planifolia]